MSLRIIGILLISSALLTGCQSTPEISGELPAPEPITNSPKSEQVPPTSTNRTSQPSGEPAQSNAVDYLSGQVTTMQEQIIQIKADTADLKQLNQLILSRLQLMGTNFTTNAANNTEGQSAEALSSVDIAQLSQQLQQLQETSDSAFKLVSGYTAKGQWVLIRYNRFTGESWLADQGNWNSINENEVISPSVFEIQLLRADKDIKGFATARIDQRSGQVWWLSENSWLKY